MAETAVTKSAALALADERALMNQGYQFLDEKRMVLAAEMLRLLDQYRDTEARLRDRQQAAQAALRRALQRHGLEGLQAYPPTQATPALLQPVRSLFMGVPQLATGLEPPAALASDDAIDASPQARACLLAFADLLDPVLQLAALSGNLERLGADYKRTERRARALENVLLPEIETALRHINEHLELADQEEGVRIRLAGRQR